MLDFLLSQPIGDGKSIMNDVDGAKEKKVSLQNGHVDDTHGDEAGQDWEEWQGVDER